MKSKLFDVLKGEGNVESAKNFNMKSLMNNVKIQETATHLYISNFPGAFGDTQNKNNRVYDQDSLVYAVNWFNDVKDDNPYFCYMFDGHKDDDSYENIIGRVIKLHTRPDIKCVMMDLKINKGAKSWPQIKNIMADGDPLGASMRILAPNAMFVSKDDLYGINPKIVFLDSDNANIAYLMSKDNEIEYITGDSFIQRFDITWFPSFNSSFVESPFKFDPNMNKSESTGFKIPNVSAVKLADYKESSVLFNAPVKCVTNGCKFRNTMKDFIDLISMDESIKNIKDNPQLYTDMVKFSYLNLDSFDFDKIVDSDYLSAALVNNGIDQKDMANQLSTLNTLIPNTPNILSFIIDNTTFDASLINSLLNMTLNRVVDEDNIFFQIVTINYMHYLILSTLILTGKVGGTILQQKQVADKLSSSLTDEGADNPIVIDLIKKVDKAEMTIYQYINSMFSYIYQYVDNYADKTAPLTIVNESMRIFRPAKAKTVIDTKFVKLQEKNK